MQTKTEIANKMIEWMKAEGWNCKEVEDPQYQILYTVSDGQTTISVGIENKIERVNIYCRINLLSDAQNSYKLSPNKQIFWFELKVRLMLLGVHLTALPNFQTPQFFNLFEAIYFDAFTRDKLIHSIINIIDGAGLCNLMWQQFVMSQQSGTIDGTE
jgi:hypothetical protein